MCKRRIGKLLVSVAVLLSCAAGRSAAGIILYSGIDAGANSTDPRPNSDAAAAALDAAVGPPGTVHVIDFETPPPLGPFVNLTVAPGVNMFGNDDGNNPQNIRNTPVGSPENLFGYNTTAGGSQFVALNGGEIDFTFSQPIDFFGFYQSGIAGGSLIFDDGSTHVIDMPGSLSTGGVEFFGFTDAGASITSVNFLRSSAATYTQVGADDVQYGQSAATPAPEPASAALLALGAAGLALVRTVSGRNRDSRTR